LINDNIVVELFKAGAKLVKMNKRVNDFGPNIVEINHSITTDLNFSNEIEKRSIIIRALVSKECNPIYRSSYIIIL